MSDILREMRRELEWRKRAGMKALAADAQRWIDHLERVEADLRESDRRYQALEQRLHETEDERERLREALRKADRMVDQVSSAAIDASGFIDRQLALSPTTDDHRCLTHCVLAEPTGVCCPDDSCDLDDGVRQMPTTDDQEQSNES